MVDKDRTEGKSFGVNQPFGRDLTVGVEDALEVLVEVFNGNISELMKDPSHFHPVVPVGISSVLCRNKGDAGAVTELLNIGSTVVGVSQEEAGVMRELGNEQFGHFIIRCIGRGKLCRQRNPNRGYSKDQMELPAVDPSMPTRFGPIMTNPHLTVRTPFLKMERGSYIIDSVQWRLVSESISMIWTFSLKRRDSSEKAIKRVFSGYPEFSLAG